MAVNVTITETVINTDVNNTEVSIALTEQVTNVALMYPGAQGAQGDSGVVNVIAPITNTGTTSSAIIGLNQSALSLARTQIIGTAITEAAGTAQAALLAGTSVYASSAGTAATAGSASNAGTALTAGTASFSLLSGTAVFSTNAGTSVFATNSGTATFATSATSATTAATATYAVTAGTSSYSTLSGTAVFASSATNAGTATTAGTSSYATLSGTAVNISGTIAATQVTGTAVTTADTATVTNTMLAGSIANNKLANSSITVNGSAVSLGGTTTITAAPTGNAGGDLTGTYPNPTLGTGVVFAANINSSLANAVAFKAQSNTFTVGGQQIQTGADSTAGLNILRNSATQSAALLTLFQSNGSTVLARFNAAGALSLSPDSGVAATVNGVSGAVSLIVKGAVGNSTNLQEWQTSAATVASISSAGALSLSPSSGTALTVNGAASVASMIVKGVSGQNVQEWWVSGGSGAALFIGSNAQLRAGVSIAGTGWAINNQQYGASVIAQVIRQATSQTADLFQFQNDSGTALGGRNALAQIYSGSTAPVTVATGGAISGTSSGTTATLTSATAHGLAVGDLVTIASMTPSGYNGTYLVLASPAPTSTTFAVTTSGSNLGNSTVSGTASVPAQSSITARSAGTVGLVVRSAGSPQVDLQRWVDSSTGNIFAKVDNSGNGQFPRFLNGGGLTSILFDTAVNNTRNMQFFSATAAFGGGSGVLGIANAGTVPTSNPTGGGVLYAEGGALKWRGSSGTITTIANA